MPIQIHKSLNKWIHKSLPWCLLCLGVFFIPFIWVRDIKPIQDQITAQNQTIQTLSHQLYVQQKASRQQSLWSLEHIRYLLVLAQINAIGTNDTTTTRTLLETADHLLKKETDPRLRIIRQSLREEIATQANFKPHDWVHFFNQVHTLQQICTDHEASRQHSTTSKEIHHPYRLKDLFILHHEPDPTIPLLTPTLKKIQFASLTLLTEAIQWAALQKNNTLYQTLLNEMASQALNLLETSSTQYTIFKETLQDLRTLSWDQHPPIPESALTALDQLIQEERSA